MLSVWLLNTFARLVNEISSSPQFSGHCGPGHSSDKNCLNFRFCLTLEDEKIQVVQNFGYKKTFLFLNQFQNFLRLWVKKDQNFTLKLPIQD